MTRLYLKEKDLPFYPNWQKIFENSNPIYVEIGIGKGDFILEMAKNNPQVNFVGVDYSREVLRSAVRKVEGAQLKNVRLIPMEGTKFLCKAFTSEAISGLYLNFPDPWIKRKKAKNRLVNEAFPWLLADRLKLSGFFRMATDYKPYIEQTVEFFLKTGAFTPLWEEVIRTEVEDFYPTKYAKKWLSLGRTLYFTGFKKIKRVELPNWVKDYYPLLKISGDELLPIVNILKLNQQPDFKKLYETLPRGIIYQKEENLVKVLDVYFKDNGVLVDLLVKEGSLKERFFILISPYQKDGVILTSHEATPPDPTDLVHLAFVLLCKEVLKVYPSAHILKTTCKEKFLKSYLNLAC
jgi:tRNA (guanine-N7-)-methyltransferase